jgi:putative flippase GtrA
MMKAFGIIALGVISFCVIVTILIELVLGEYKGKLVSFVAGFGIATLLAFIMNIE